MTGQQTTQTSQTATNAENNLMNLVSQLGQIESGAPCELSDLQETKARLTAMQAAIPVALALVCALIDAKNSGQNGAGPG